MQLGRVLGTATTTVKHPSFQGERLLVVQLEGLDGRAMASRSWCSTGSGRGEGMRCW